MNDLRRESSGYLSGIDNSTTDPQGTVEGRLRRQLAYFQGYADRRDAEIERLQAEVGRLGKYVTRALAAHERGDPVWARELLIECVLTKDTGQQRYERRSIGDGYYDVPVQCVDCGEYVDDLRAHCERNDINCLIRHEERGER